MYLIITDHQNPLDTRRLSVLDWNPSAPSAPPIPARSSKALPFDVISLQSLFLSVFNPSLPHPPTPTLHHHHPRQYTVVQRRRRRRTWRGVFNGVSLMGPSFLFLRRVGAGKRPTTAACSLTVLKLESAACRRAAAQQVLVSANKVFEEFCQQEGQLVLLQAFAG